MTSSHAGPRLAPTHERHPGGLMRSSFGITTLFAVLPCALVGCASSPEAQGELTEDSVNQNALADNADAYGYFGLAADIRRCPSPSCGGWYLTGLNRSTT